MKPNPLKLDQDKARIQLKNFALWGLILSLLGLIISWLLGLVGLALGARALMLAGNEHIKQSNETQKYRIMAIIAVAIGVVDVAAILLR